MRVLRTAGVQPERDLGYATMYRLLRPLLGGIADLPSAQADALDRVFGRPGAGPTPDRFLIALATLTLLSDAAQAQPLLCLIDDAHWADQPSLDALSFASRRLRAEPIALFFATRLPEGRPGPLAGLPELPLTGLDAASARRLLREHTGGSLPASDEELLLRTAAGNPLALRELPASVPPGGPTGEPLPLVDRLQEAFLAQLLPLSGPARELLLLAAVDGSGWLHILRRATATHLDAPVDLDSALDELRGLLSVSSLTVEFRHPLVRSAVFHSASVDRRRAAHLALAAALEHEPAERDRRAWHLGRATDDPDETVAAELERAADRQTHRGGPAAAAAALARAAQLTPPGPDRARRLVAAATASWYGGDAARAEERLALAERIDTRTPDTATRITMLRALIELRTGDAANSLRLLRPVVRQASGQDPTTAVEVLKLFLEASYHAGDANAWGDVAEAIEGMPLLGEHPDLVLLRVIQAGVRVRTGAPAALAESDLGLIEQWTDPEGLCWGAAACWYLGDKRRYRRLYRKALERAHSVGAIGTVTWVLVHVVRDEMTTGRVHTAAGFAEDGKRHAAETGQPNLACWFDSALAVLAALAGRGEQARDLADQVLQVAVRRNLVAAAVQARQALGLVALAEGHGEQALGHLLDTPDHLLHPAFVLGNVPDAVEAAHRMGRLELVAKPVGRFVRWAEATGSPELRALAARCQALTGTEEPEPAFRRALELHPVDEQPVDRARTQLLYGEYLRRARRRGDARRLLRAALESFEQLGMDVWADRARDELRATGETPTSPTRDTLTTLTPQELRIARAAAEGATNREIATQLFVSPRTIDYHLRKIFQKTGITSRVELILLTLPRAEQR
ncbi:DNA-binding CsgD family transcriptional regulator [Pseudonocardia eucalypti]|nr:DNA-binding CsgD family transcriptional regulator [Pseudonocardia eucalypti]